MGGESSLSGGYRNEGRNSNGVASALWFFPHEERCDAVAVPSVRSDRAPARGAV